MPNNKVNPSEGTSEEKQAPELTIPDLGIEASGPWAILQTALKAVPALKYALAVLGIVSAITIIKSFGVDFRVATFGTIVMLVLMVALVVFAALTKVRSRQVRWASFLLMWSFLTLTVLSAALLFTSAFFEFPKPLGTLFTPLTPGPILDPTDRDQTTAMQKSVVVIYRENDGYTTSGIAQFGLHETNYQDNSFNVDRFQKVVLAVLRANNVTVPKAAFRSFAFDRKEWLSGDEPLEQIRSDARIVLVESSAAAEHSLGFFWSIASTSPVFSVQPDVAEQQHAADGAARRR